MYRQNPLVPHCPPVPLPGDGVLTWSDLYVYVDRKHGNRFYTRALVKTITCFESCWT